MKIHPLISGLLASALLLATTFSAQAAMIGTTELVQQDRRGADLALVQTFVERSDVQSRLEAFGVDPLVAADRIDALTDAELQELALNIETLPAGGDGLGIVLVVLLILVLLELLGITNLFSKI